MSRRSVLVVDDERNIRMTLRTAIEGLATEIREAPDGATALAEHRRDPADLILLDLRMPVLDGMETLRRLRSEDPQVRVVVITAHGSIDDAVEAMKLGAADLLQKPFEPGAVRRVVAGVLSGTGREAPPQDPRALIARARDLLRQDRLAEAEIAVRRSLAAAPGEAEPMFLLGVVRDRCGDRLDAQRYYRASIALKADHEYAHRNLARSVGTSVKDPLLVGDEPLDRSRR